MKIHLDIKEIETALVAYVANQGINITHKEIEVDVVAGRGANGHSATIDITPEVETKVTLESVPKAEVVKEATPEVSNEEPADNSSLFN